MSDEELEELAKSDQFELEELKEMREKEQKRDSMSLEELLQKEHPNLFLKITPSNRSQNYKWVWFDIEKTPSEIGTNQNSIQEIADRIIDWHTLGYNIKKYTDYELDTSSYRMKEHNGRKVLVATIKPQN